jgi:hypothetical protein
LPLTRVALLDMLNEPCIPVMVPDEVLLAVRPVLDTLRQTGMYLSSELARHVLEQAGK